MTSVKGDTKHTMAAEATAGSGKGKYGIAGGFAIEIADVRTSAVLPSTSSLTVAPDGDVTFRAVSNTSSAASALGKAEATGALGLGLGFALNISNPLTEARIDNGAQLTGGRSLTLEATSENYATTKATAGGAAAGSVGIGGAFGITLVNNETYAKVGGGNPLNLKGNLKAVATHKGSTNTYADSTASGKSAGIGITLALNVVTDKTEATTDRDVTATGDITFAAHASTETTTQAKASATGAPGEKPAGEQDPKGVDSTVAAQRTYADGMAGSNGTKGGGDAGATPEAKSDSGPVSVAAAISINLSNSIARASIPDGRTVNSGGLLWVSSSNHADGTAKADGSAVNAENNENDYGIGVAVAINKVRSVNEATIGQNANVTAGFVTVEALVTQVENNPKPTTNAEALSGASGKELGLAGSLAINLSGSTSSALIKSGANVIVTGGDVRVVAEDVASNTAAGDAKASSNGVEVERAPVTAESVLGSAKGEVDVTPLGGGKNDLKFTLRDGTEFEVSLDGAETIQDVVDLINEQAPDADEGDGSKLTATWDEAQHRLVLVDLTAGPVPPSSCASMTGNPVMYKRSDDTTLSAPTASAKTSDEFKFAIKYSNLQRVFVTVDSKTYTGTTDAEIQKKWLTDVKEAVRTAMVAKGQIADKDPAAIEVSWRKNWLTFTSDRTLTIWSDLEETDSFRVENSEDSTAAAALGIDRIDGNEDGTINGSTLKSSLGPGSSETSGGVGVGISIAVNVSTTDAIAEIQNGATIKGANNLTMAASVDATTKTTTTAGGAATSGSGTGIAGAVSVAIVNGHATTRIGTGETLKLNGALSAKSTQKGATTTVSDGVASGNDTAVGISIALNVLHDAANSWTERSIESTGNITFQASGLSSSIASASAVASGAAEASSGETGKSGTGVNDPIKSKQDYGDSVSTSDAGTMDSAGAAGEGGSPDGQKADTSDGGVSVAAAIAVNLAWTKSCASIADGMTVTSKGAVRLLTSANTDAASKADGSAASKGSDSGTGVGAAVAINYAVINNTATTGITTINAAGVGVESTMTVSGDDTTHTLSAQTIAGAGSANIGIAGSVPVNIVSNRTEAYAPQGADVTATGGDVSFVAESNQESICQATATVTDAGDVGVGASVAVNVLTPTITRAEIEDGVRFVGGKSLTIRATSKHNVNTKATAGAAAGESDEPVMVSPAVAITVVSDRTTARIGTHPTGLVVTGPASILAQHTGSATTLADASAAGKDVSVGAAVGVGVVKVNTVANLSRNLTAKSVAVDATTDQSASVETNAGANGASKEKDKDADETSDEKVDKNPNTKGADGGDLPSAGEEADTSTSSDLPNAADGVTDGSSTSSGQSGQGSSGVGVAAAVAVNVLIINNTASISDGLVVVATDGPVEVIASNRASGVAKATGVAINDDITTWTSSDGSTAGIGAGVAVNVCVITNTGRIGAYDHVTGRSVSVGAITPDGSRNDFTTWGISASAANQETGVAASIAVAVIVERNKASIGNHADIDSSGDVSVIASAPYGVQTLAISGAYGEDVGVGAAIVVTVLKPTTEAWIEPDSTVDAAGTLRVSAASSIVPLSVELPLIKSKIDVSAIAVAGAVTQGDAAVGGSILVDIYVINTHAFIGDRVRVNDSAVSNGSQNVIVIATDNTTMKEGAGGFAGAMGSAGIGAGVVVNVLSKDVKAYIGPSVVLHAANDVTVSAVSTEKILALAACVGVSTDSAGVERPSSSWCPPLTSSPTSTMARPLTLAAT